MGAPSNGMNSAPANFEKSGAGVNFSTFSHASSGKSVATSNYFLADQEDKTAKK